jgi:hypothetical protein
MQDPVVHAERANHSSGQTGLLASSHVLHLSARDCLTTHVNNAQFLVGMLLVNRQAVLLLACKQAVWL